MSNHLLARSSAACPPVVVNVCAFLRYLSPRYFPRTESCCSCPEAMPRGGLEDARGRHRATRDGHGRMTTAVTLELAGVSTSASAQYGSDSGLTRR
jgi:hypothetical protein